MNEHTETNRHHWNETVAIHVASEMYDVAGFRAGRDSLTPVEHRELGDVRGKSLLHVQCHFGMDTLSWARAGAHVTGADYSEAAIAQARALADELGIDARFVLSDVYSLSENLDGQFDIVFTSKGVLCWLPDLPRWAQVVARFVKPGGTFYIIEFHPYGQIFDDRRDATDLEVHYPYFPLAEPIRFDDAGDYTDRDVKLKNETTFEWFHPVSEVVTTLIDAGLRIDFLHEFPFTGWKSHPFMEYVDDQHARLTIHDGSVPLTYSVKATKPVAG